MKERVLAVLGAVALIVGAVFVRGLLAGDDGGGSTPGGGPSRPSGRPVVGCTPDLAAICQQLADDGVIADQPPSFDLGSPQSTTGEDGDRRIDGWIAWNPAPAIANVDADDVQVWGRGAVLGSSPLAVAVLDGTQLPTSCSATSMTWACVSNAPALGGSTGIAIGRAGTAEGLIRFWGVANVIAGDAGFNSIDANRAKAVIESSVDQPSAFADQWNSFLTANGKFDIAVGPKAGLHGTRKSYRVSVPQDPALEMAIVVAPRTGVDLDEVVRAFADDEELAQALKAAGVTPTPDGQAADETNAGDLYAVREKVTD